MGGMRGGVGDAPSVVEFAQVGGGAKALIGVVEGGADFVEGSPAPEEFDFCGVALGGDAGDGFRTTVWPWLRDGDGSVAFVRHRHRVDGAENEFDEAGPNQWLGYCGLRPLSDFHLLNLKA